MSDEHVHELAALYALGGLDPEEAVRVEAHLAACAACRQAVEEAREVADALPAVWEAPPAPHIKKRLMQRVRAARRPASKSRGFSLRGLGLAPLFAALAVVLSAALAAWTLSLQQRLQTLETQYAAAQAQLQSQVELVSLLNTPGVRLANLQPTGAGSAAIGQALWNPDTKQALFITRALTPAPAGKTYQLWLIGASGPVSVGVIQVDANGWARVAVTQPDVLQDFAAAGISLEPMPGSQTPTDVVLLGEF